MPLSLGPGVLDPANLLSSLGLLGVLAAVFAETGLLVGFFLPGDSLLFTAGLFAARAAPFAPLWLLLVLVPVAAIVGDQVGYLIGKRAGQALFQRADSRLYKRSYVERSRGFFERYGARTILLARFVPVVRTLLRWSPARRACRTAPSWPTTSSAVWSGE